MKMKIAVITMQGVYNYGSALQTYATQHYLESLGHTVEIIDYYPYRMRNYGTVRQLYREAFPFHKNAIKSGVIALIKYCSVRKLRASFDPFYRTYTTRTRKYESNQELYNDPPIADVYCTGSDQVWNDYLEGKFDQAYFLDFAPAGAKKIAYSASFGRENITGQELAPVKKLLEQYDAISVREEAGLNILRSVNVALKSCLLDPSFMIPADCWKQMAEDISDKDYILVYKLHEDSITSEIAIKLGKMLKKRVIRISNDYLKRIKGGKTEVAPRVEEFISYISNACMVVTDSFHATAFSINLNVPFISIRWKMFNNRIETILKKTGLEERCVSSMDEAIAIYKKAINFDLSNKKLEKARRETEEFFISCRLKS